MVFCNHLCSGGLHMLAKETFLEKQDSDNAGGDSSISDVEYRTEEHEIITAFERHPFRQVAFIDREIQHIHHAAVQEAAIAAARRQELRYFVSHAVVEDQAIEHTVDQVAGGASQYQRTAYQQAGAILFMYQLLHIKETRYHGHEPEERKEDLSEVASEFQAIGHPFVFNEMYAEPVRENNVFLLHEHVGLDPELQHLVNCQDKDNDKNDVTIFQLILEFCQK